MQLSAKYILPILFSFLLGIDVHAQAIPGQQKQAIAYLDSVGEMQQSNYWPNVKPTNFIQNLRKNISQPLFVYAGNNTNFCGFAALSYSCIGHFPLRYARFMVELYKNGKADFRDVHFTPSANVKRAAGSLRYHGELDINHADQLWFLSLADHFKGYVNWINMNFDRGDEDKFWAATNFAKFNRMVRKMCNYDVHAVGSDLMRPGIKDIIVYLNKRLAENDQVFLYLNNTILHKKDHAKVRKRIPTHYVVLLNITESNGQVSLTYWDYGFKTLQQLPYKVVKKILFGVSWCKKKSDT
jgi:hypothetical protein